MTPSQRAHLTCLLRFPVYRYLYPLAHEYSNGFARLAVLVVHRLRRVDGAHKDKMYPKDEIADQYGDDFAFIAFSGALGSVGGVTAAKGCASL